MLWLKIKLHESKFVLCFKEKQGCINVEIIILLQRQLFC